MKVDHAYILYIDREESVRSMEECKISCEKYGVPVIPFEGVSFPTTVQHVQEKLNVSLDPDLDNGKILDRIPEHIWEHHYKEQLCTSGHLSIWQRIAKQKHAVAVFEHDATVKADVRKVDVEDGQIVFLGHRIDHVDDYECIDEPFQNIRIRRFEGTHAYAITPTTAEFMLNTIKNSWKHLPVGVSVDKYLGINNIFGLHMFIADPAPVISAQANRQSFTTVDGNVGRYMQAPQNGFIKGLTNPDKYRYDAKNNWLVW